jgi:hypothetical protein
VCVAENGYPDVALVFIGGRVQSEIKWKYLDRALVRK